MHGIRSDWVLIIRGLKMRTLRTLSIAVFLQAAVMAVSAETPALELNVRTVKPGRSVVVASFKGYDIRKAKSSQAQFTIVIGSAQIQKIVRANMFTYIATINSEFGGSVLVRAQGSVLEKKDPTLPPGSLQPIPFADVVETWVPVLPSSSTAHR